MLRETDVKDICVAIAKDKIIRGTWSGEQKRKPHDRHMIELTTSSRRNTK
jgi:hypothetical protein